MLSFLIPQAYAQCTPGQGVNLTECFSLGSGKGTVGSVYSKPSDIINLLVNNAFVLAGIILFLMVIFAGFKFISNSSKGQEDAKNILTTAMIGFILLFSAYWIVKIILIITGQNTNFI